MTSPSRIPGASRRLVIPRAFAAAAALVLLAACGSDGSSGEAATTAATVTTRATTTSMVASTTTAASTTTGSTAAPTTTLPAVSVPDDAPVLTADDAVLAAPKDPPPLELGGEDPCRLLTGTASLGGCGVVDGADGQLVWFVSDADSPDPTAVMIYRVEGDSLVQTLELPEELRSGEGLAHVEAADLDGVAGDEIVVGFRDDGSGAFLELEVIGSAGTVIGHLTLDHGKAVVTAGSIETWAAEFGPNDPNCCPKTFAKTRVVFHDGEYRLVSEGSVPTDTVEDGQFL